LIKRREAYFDLLVSGYSVEQIASHTESVGGSSRGRSGLGEAAARCARVLRPPPGRPVDEALRCADVSLEEGDLRAIAPFVKVVRELNLYHGVSVGSARPTPEALPEIAPTSPRLALTHSPGAALTEVFKDEKSCAKAQLSV
jgi:hypothetical protein